MGVVWLFSIVKHHGQSYLGGSSQRKERNNEVSRRDDETCSYLLPRADERLGANPTFT
jgi:hypothetical protein